jgi:SAM-dependent methyltransferase
VCQQLSPVKEQSLLEIACGRGALVEWAARHGAHAVGCDISFTAVREARQRFGKGFLLGDIHHTCFRSESFDTVVCCETLEHTLDPDGALRELFRITRPGGRLFLTTPSYLNTYGLYRMYLRACGRPFGVHGIQPIDRCFLSPMLPGRFRRAGWKIRRTAGLVHYLRPARDRLRFIESSPFLSGTLKYFALHFAIEAERVAT